MLNRKISYICGALLLAVSFGMNSLVGSLVISGPFLPVGEEISSDVLDQFGRIGCSDPRKEQVPKKT